MLSSSDEDVEKFLKLFTFLDLDAIATVMKEHQPTPEKRVAQHRLAHEVVSLAHGSSIADATALEHTQRANQRQSISLEAAFANAAAEAVASARQGLGKPVALTQAASDASGDQSEGNLDLSLDFVSNATFPAVLQAVGLVLSKSEAQRLIKNRGAYVAKLEHEKDEKLEWSAIDTTAAGQPAKWVVWSGNNQSTGLLGLRVGKWKTKFARIHKDDNFSDKAVGMDWKELDIRNDTEESKADRSEGLREVEKQSN